MNFEGITWSSPGEIPGRHLVILWSVSWEILESVTWSSPGWLLVGLRLSPGLQKKPLIETEASTVRIYSTVNITSIYQVEQRESDI
jgi:hypothetical protein